MSRLALAALVAVIAVAFVGREAPPAGAINLPVTRFDDPAPSGCAPADCSLREAVIAANLTFGPDVITLPAGPYVLSIAGADEDAADTGDLDITDDLTVNGVGAATTSIDGADLDRVLHVLSATVSIAGVTIRNGSTTGLAPADLGGGIHNGGTLTLTNSTVSGNTAEHSGGIANYFATLTLTGSTVSGNDSVTDAGGIYNAAGTVTITSGTVSGNMAGARGGGIFGNGGSWTITDTTFNENTAGTLGAGIYNGSSALAVSNSTISGNTSSAEGGGVTSSGGTTLTNTTISGNFASTNGGGIHTFAGLMTASNSTITNNTADNDGNGSGDGGGIAVIGGTVNLKNTVLGGNLDSSSDPDCFGTVTSQGYNLIQAVSAGCNIAGDPTGNIGGVDPNLAPLANNGGLTQTHALLPGSLAIDGGSPDCPPPATDQRGVGRPINGDAVPLARCDIGAFEAPAAATPTPTPSPTPTPTPTHSPSPTATPSPTPSSTPTGHKQGDFDCNGVINGRDSLILFLFSAGLPLLSREPDCPDIGTGTPAFGDVNCDGVVDAGDGLGPLAFAAEVSFFQENGCTPLGQTLAA